jgi:hypothetical protein
MLDEIPNNSIAKPAVTIVTAVCIVNIVIRERIKYVNKTDFPSL